MLVCFAPAEAARGWSRGSENLRVRCTIESASYRTPSGLVAGVPLSTGRADCGRSWPVDASSWYDPNKHVLAVQVQEGCTDPQQVPCNTRLRHHIAGIVQGCHIVGLRTSSQGSHGKILCSTASLHRVGIHTCLGAVWLRKMRSAGAHTTRLLPDGSIRLLQLLSATLLDH